jgi:rhodanese-related sulfurtransferase
MPSPTEITISQLSRLIGLPAAPLIIDVRDADDFANDPRLVPGSCRRDYSAAPHWIGDASQFAVIICQKGKKLSQGAAAWLRTRGTNAVSLEGGFEAWRDANQMLLTTAKFPKYQDGKTVWVTRARPKIDRIACPWLIRRFVDPGAVFLFVAPAEVMAVAERFDATPFDIDDVFWSHRGETCTFDTMIAEFELVSKPLQHLARIVRAADTARPDLAPEAAGLLAASLGYSRMYKDDLAQLDAAMALYDALFRWCRDATDETHNWPAAKPTGREPP